MPPLACIALAKPPAGSRPQSPLGRALFHFAESRRQPVNTPSTIASQDSFLGRGSAMVSLVERTPFPPSRGRLAGSLLPGFFPLRPGALVLSLPASPPVAARLGLEPFYFVNRHV